MRIPLSRYLFIVFCFAVAACQGENVPNRRERTAKKSINSIPMESVDVETGGKKGGGTHFNLSSDELFLDYQYYDDEAQANAQFDFEKPRTRVKQVIERGNVPGKDGVIEGKFLFTENDSSYGNLQFCLGWSRANRYAIVCSASRQAIEEFRAVYDL